MKTKLLGLVATLAAGALFSVEAQAVTLQTTNFITSPNYFNGFESIEVVTEHLLSRRPLSH